jgi:hypothetical protein
LRHVNTLLERARQRWLRRAAAFAACSAAVLACAVPAQAATWYASATSTDVVGACASLSPCRLDRAVGAAAAGDEVVVQPGDYAVSYAVATSASVNIHGAANKPRPRVVAASSLTGAVVKMSGGGFVSHLYIEAGKTAPSAFDADGVVAGDLVIAAPGGVGAHLMGASLLRDSVVSAAGTGPAVDATDGSATGGAVKLLNDTLIAPGTGATALRARQTGATTVVRNTVMRGSGGDVTTEAGARVAIDHSSLRPNASSGYKDLGSNTNAEPGFVDFHGGDFHLTSVSPLVDAGTAGDKDLGSVDPDGAKRVLGNAPDIGAYESPYSASAPGLGGGSTGTGGGDGGAAGDTTSRGTLAPASPPVAGSKLNVGTASGSVSIRPPSASGYVPLTTDASVPVGSTIDATDGVVQLTSVRDASGSTQTARFWGGVFKVAQRGAGYTDLVLRGGDFGVCRHGAHAKAFAARASKRAVRGLWGSDSHGRFRTRGRGGQAIVRGTKWLTQDRCDGTLFRVRKGAIAVKGKHAHRTVVLRAGESLLAR